MLRGRFYVATKLVQRPAIQIAEGLLRIPRARSITGLSESMSAVSRADVTDSVGLHIGLHLACIGSVSVSYLASI